MWPPALSLASARPHQSGGGGGGEEKEDKRKKDCADLRRRGKRIPIKSNQRGTPRSQKNVKKNLLLNIFWTKWFIILD